MKPRNSAKSGGEFPWGFVLVIVGLLVSLLSFNYFLNVEAEKNTPPNNRPYGNYKTEDLATLIAGYETELEELAGRETQLKAKQSAPRARQTLQENVDEFEKTTSAARDQRAVALQIGQTQAVLSDLRAEKQLRDQSKPAATGWSRHVRRLFNFGELLKKI